MFVVIELIPCYINSSSSSSGGSRSSSCGGTGTDVSKLSVIFCLFMYFYSRSHGYSHSNGAIHSHEFNHTFSRVQQPKHQHERHITFLDLYDDLCPQQLYCQQHPDSHQRPRQQRRIPDEASRYDASCDLIINPRNELLFVWWNMLHLPNSEKESSTHGNSTVPNDANVHHRQWAGQTWLKMC